MLSNVRKTGVAILVMVSKVTVKGVGEGDIRNCFGNVGEGDIRNCFGKLNDSGKPALRRPGILPQQLSTSPFVCTSLTYRVAKCLTESKFCCGAGILKRRLGVRLSGPQAMMVGATIHQPRSSLPRQLSRRKPSISDGFKEAPEARTSIADGLRIQFLRNLF